LLKKLDGEWDFAFTGKWVKTHGIGQMQEGGRQEQGLEEKEAAEFGGEKFGNSKKCSN
jgi:hypothetical protein